MDGALHRTAALPPAAGELRNLIGGVRHSGTPGTDGASVELAAAAQAATDLLCLVR